MAFIVGKSMDVVNLWTNSWMSGVKSMVSIVGKSNLKWRIFQHGKCEYQRVLRGCSGCMFVLLMVMGLPWDLEI